MQNLDFSVYALDGDSMPNIVYDESKGFCYGADDSRTLRLRENVNSTGFNLIPWDELIPLIEEDTEVETEKSTKKMTKQEKRAQRQQKKINVARKKKLERDSISDQVQDQESNPIMVDSQIRKLYTKILKLSDTPKNQDVKLFQYESIAMYKSDVEYLLPGEWLNDSDISLIYELLTQLVLKELKHGNQVQLLFPSLIQLFLHFPSDYESVLPISDLKNLKFIFIPINFIDDFDSVDLESANQGDHWALAIFSVLESKLYLYDSMISDENSDQKLLNELSKRLVSCKNTFNVNKIDIQTMKCDQQSNFDDCGVYLLMITCFMLNKLLFSDGAINMDISQVKFDPLKTRLTMMDLVHRLYSQTISKT